MRLRTFYVTLDPAVADIEVEGDAFWLDESGVLKIMRNRVLVAFFPAGKWAAFMDTGDEGAR